MTAQLVTRRLDVPGGNLFYEVRGSGPLLLVIGQPMTSGPFASLADLLAAEHTVVTYDPHGLGLSTVDDESLDVTPEIEADDLAHLLDALGGGPADVFGSSGGAVAGLAFATRYPDRVGTLVAHEPPVTELLPDAAPVRAAIDRVEDAYRAGGSAAAWAAFVSLVVHNGPVTEAGVPPTSWPPPGRGDAARSNEAGSAAEDRGSAEPPPAPSAKAEADGALFFLRMLKPFTRYRPDIAALRSGAPRVLIGLGATSRQELAPRSAVALAERLGTPPVVFPGDHAGFMADPVGFADTLRRALGS
jgi:pimeloyl-ACP methyl ester carboxylesterase